MGALLYVTRLTIVNHFVSRTVGWRWAKGFRRPPQYPVPGQKNILVSFSIAAINIGRADFTYVTVLLFV